MRKGFAPAIILIAGLLLILIVATGAYLVLIKRKNTGTFSINSLKNTITDQATPHKLEGYAYEVEKGKLSFKNSQQNLNNITAKDLNDMTYEVTSEVHIITFSGEDKLFNKHTISFKGNGASKNLQTSLLIAGSISPDGRWVASFGQPSFGSSPLINYEKDLTVFDLQKNASIDFTPAKRNKTFEIKDGVYYFTWGPNNQILFTEGITGNGEPFKVGVLDVLLGTVQFLAEDNVSVSQPLGWSADGKSIFYWTEGSENDVYKVNLQNKTKSTVFSWPQFDKSGIQVAVFAGEPMLSPDGKHLLVSEPSRIHGDPKATGWDLNLYDVNTKSFSTITSNKQLPLRYSFGQNSNSVMFSTDIPDKNLSIVNLQTMKVQNVLVNTQTNSNDLLYNAGLSLDGKSLLLERSNFGGKELVRTLTQIDTVTGHQTGVVSDIITLDQSGNTSSWSFLGWVD